MKLTTLCKQTEKAKANVVVEFRAQQYFIDVCAIYYGEGFDDCLKQVVPIYPNLDLSKISMDDIVPATLASDDTVNEETDDSTQTKHNLKDDDVVLTQYALERLVTPLVPSTEDPPTNDAENPSALNAQNPSTRDAENPSPQDAQNPSAQF